MHVRVRVGLLALAELDVAAEGGDAAVAIVVRVDTIDGDVGEAIQIVGEELDARGQETTHVHVAHKRVIELGRAAPRGVKEHTHAAVGPHARAFDDEILDRVAASVGDADAVPGAREDRCAAAIP